MQNSHERQRQPSLNTTGSVLNLPNPSRSAHDFVVLRDDEEGLQDASEDTVDGMATIADTETKDSRFFGKIGDVAILYAPNFDQGPSSNIAFLREISASISTGLRTQMRSQRLGDDPTQQQLVSRLPTPELSLSAATPASPNTADACGLPSRAHALTLMDHFFSDTGMLFPFVHEGFMRKSYEDFRRTNFSNVKRSWLCLLNMIFAFATILARDHDESIERNVVESKVYFNRAQSLFAEAKMRLADLELGEFSLVVTMLLPKSNVYLPASSSMSASHEPIPPGNPEIGRNLVIAWPCYSCRYSNRVALSTNIGGPQSS